MPGTASPTPLWPALVGVALLQGCSGALLGPWLRGIDDRDGDGFPLQAGDCDDRDPLVYPSAVDWPLDEIDSDCDGADASSLPVARAEPGMLRITEIMPAPLAVGDALGEWIEIESRSEYDIDLEGLLLFDDERDDAIIAAPLLLPAGERLVLGAWADPERNGGAPVDYAYGASFGLSNRADAIVLSTGAQILAEARWDARYPLQDGYSLSLDPDAEDPLDPASWCLPGDSDVYGPGGRGSPGEGNPGCPEAQDAVLLSDIELGDLVITELMTDPSAVGGDFGEWIELTNTSDADIELLGMSVSDDSGDGFEIWHSLVVGAGQQVILGSFVDRAVNGDTPVDFEWRWDFGLANSGDTVRLSYGTREIDEISYDNGNTFPDPEGASMSLDPSALSPGENGALLNDDGARWCVGATPYGAGDLGTPGAENPPCPAL